ncbi:MAG: hypothetical protein U0838_00615 [Chloroflexota bacterium]
MAARLANPRHRPARNDDALAELAHARQLVARSLDLRPEPEPAVERIEIGLDQMGWWPAHYVDRVLREGGAPPRLAGPPRARGGPRRRQGAGPHRPDRGHGPRHVRALVPESISGLVLLDLTEQLGPGERGGALRPLRAAVRAQRLAAAARQGRTVYHKDCHGEHRAVAIREHHRALRAAAAEAGRRVTARSGRGASSIPSAGGAPSLPSAGMRRAA